jgi:hypothetical protein
MRYLFGYKPGKVISEQDLPEEDYEMEDDISFYDDEDEDMSDILGYDDELFEEDDDIMFAEPDVAEPEVKPDTDVDPDVRPHRPRRPSRENLPDYDPQPQGRRKPSRDEVMYKLEFDDTQERRPMRRMRDMDENIYEIEIDGDIAELFKK